MIIYRLTSGGANDSLYDTEIGLFLSIEGAKLAAQEKLNEYHKFDDDDDTETLTTETLVWEYVRTKLGETFGWDPIPTATYGLENGSCFRITQKEVKP